MSVYHDNPTIPTIFLANFRVDSPTEFPCTPPFRNLGQNICRISHVLAQFRFTTKDTEPDYYQKKVNVRVAKRVVERLNT